MVNYLDNSILTTTINKRPVISHKGDYGRVLLIGGNHNFGGAIVMATTACVYSGAGLVTTASNSLNLTSLHSWVPEAMFIDYYDTQMMVDAIAKSDVIVIGPGLGDNIGAFAILQSVLTSVTESQTLIIDGSAITLMSNHPVSLPTDTTMILTPHQMEWQRLSGIPIAEQTDLNNQQAAQNLGAIVVVKSHETTIYDGNDIYKNPKGTPAQATGGMGDTLAGMIGGFCAQFKDPTKATLAAVYAHSAIAEQLAADNYVVLPHQISQEIPHFMKQYER